ncbi:MAG: hypothetical protein COB41_00300 [Proteobacteria bacterium]|nr:MAG: hypothetical protein COB41_00300 [Pseudomonadota bacterium]
MKQTKKENLSDDTSIKSFKKIVENKKEQTVDVIDSILLEKKDKQILKLKQKIEELTYALANPVVEKIQINDEEMIAIMQLQHLKKVSQTRELTLEESRKFEIFSKVKNSINRQSSIDTNSVTLPRSLDPSMLLQIANGKKTT